MSDVTNDEVRKLIELLPKAAPLPWKLTAFPGGNANGGIAESGGATIGGFVGEGRGLIDAELTCTAVNLIDRLFPEYLRYRRALEDLAFFHRCSSMDAARRALGVLVDDKPQRSPVGNYLDKVVELIEHETKKYDAALAKLPDPVQAGSPEHEQTAFVSGALAALKVLKEKLDASRKEAGLG